MGSICREHGKIVKDRGECPGCVREERDLLRSEREGILDRMVEVDDLANGRGRRRRWKFEVEVEACTIRDATLRLACHFIEAHLKERNKTEVIGSNNKVVWEEQPL
jgi:hypothetical protein